MPRGRGHGPRMSNEKAKDFKGTMKKLMAYLSAYKIGIFFVIVFAIGSTIFNIVGPKILGNSTGLSAFWVVTSILLGGGLFGFVGMVMGVPTFAVIYYIVDMPQQLDLVLNVEDLDDTNKAICDNIKDDDNPIIIKYVFK